MKSNIFFCLVIFLIITGCSSYKKSPMEGTWRVVSWERKSGDSVLWNFPGKYTGSEMKIWSDRHFSFTGRYKRDSVYVDNFGAGTFTLIGKHYQEDNVYYHDTAGIGTTASLILEIRNDTVIQTWPVDKNWNVIKSNYSIQRLVRLK
jgi:hypothetical protein